MEIGAHPLRRSITPRDERAARRLAATPLLLQVAARTADHERIMPAEIGAQRALWPLLEHLEDDERWGADAWAILRDGTRTAQREAEAARTGARRQINLDAAEVLADAVRAVAYAQRIDA